MQKAPVLKGSGLAPIDDEPVHVFGRNLESRVVETCDQEDKKEDDSKPEEDDVETIKKRKFDAITGEENEETVFQGEFKLFVWDFASSNWIERGRGQLKLNDDLEGHRSRLIMRAGGTFRIILNVAIRHSLFKVISNTKTSIRFTDSQNVWAASGSNAKQLGDLLNDRIEEAAQTAKDEDLRTKELDNERSNSEERTTGEKEEQGQDENDEHASEGASSHEKEDNEDRTKPATDESQESKEASHDDETKEDAEADLEPTHKQDNEIDKEDDAKEVVVATTQDEDTEEQHKGNDEKKRLKLSSD